MLILALNNAPAADLDSNGISDVREWEGAEPPSAHELAGRRSREMLTEYVKANNVTMLYGCWSGDEGLPPVGQESIPLARLNDLAFEFPERVKLDLEPNPTQSPSSPPNDASAS